MMEGKSMIGGHDGVAASEKIGNHSTNKCSHKEKEMMMSTKPKRNGKSKFTRNLHPGGENRRSFELERGA
jgi:hypothetical protein